ncbi:heme o synthase [Candidatus Magnetominusculus dajiuhuensis]|uniref:heme o synthase n=1 Tax=Candidatus Magnetominusculus dajiuhuensis TaxID=3137712 RepID=UPI003B4303D2
MKEDIMAAKTASYREIVRDHVVLAKPGIVLLVMITTLGGMYMGQRGLPEPWLILLTLVPVGLATAGAAMLNNFYDRDIDILMSRTLRRPIPRGRVYPLNALILGLSLILISIVILLFVNTIAAALTATSAFIYVIPYTVLLKRKTHLVTHVGSITGALPPAIGYVAVRGTVGLEAMALFAIMFIWQHPHFWAYALKYKDDYSRAGVPVLPLSKGVKGTKLRTLIYTIALLPVSVMPYYLKMSGMCYLVLATGLGLIYIALAVKAYLSEKETGRLLFVYSLVYISILFTGLVADMVVK